MTNNFELINDLLDFTQEDTFYFVQILKRRKENPLLSKSSVVVE